MANICAPGKFPTNAKEFAIVIQQIEDMGFEAASAFIENHNNLMKILFLFGGTEEIELGNKLPKMLVIQGFSSLFGNISDEVRKFLP